MTALRLLEYIEQMEKAAASACSFVGEMTRDEFLADAKTQMAVAMSFVILGESVSRILMVDPHIDSNHPQVPWMKIKGMRNLIAHDYFELELDVVWKTVQEQLPLLVSQLRMLRQIHAQGE
jgi:uncharacterized protein with HEPN domain